jgi:hypothetical protein
MKILDALSKKKSPDVQISRAKSYSQAKHVLHVEQTGFFSL